MDNNTCRVAYFTPDLAKLKYMQQMALLGSWRAWGFDAGVMV